MAAFFRYMRLMGSVFLMLVLVFAAINRETCIYLLRQAKGQWHILYHAQEIHEFSNQNHLSGNETENIRLITLIKNYSVDSLGYKPTGNFTKIYNQKNKPVLWVVTASEKFSLRAYEWQFLVIGSVSYKGFFKEELAEKEKNRFVLAGYDVGIRSVSAWSTLGWLNDPLLSNHLQKSKGSFCNLLFHELFHATMYHSGKVDDNENLANFIADKATRRFLKTDTIALNHYIRKQNVSQQLVFFLKEQTRYYSMLLDSIANFPNKNILKQKALVALVTQLKKHPSLPEHLKEQTAAEILTEQNAFFIDYKQYYSKQDSLENIFNNFYKGDLKNMVQSLSE